MAQTPCNIDLHTLNEIGPILDAEVKMRVCELEQQMNDALTKEYFSTASELKAAAREMDLLRYRISSVITAVFLDALEAQETARAEVSNVERFPSPATPSLPEIPAKSRTLHVVSQDSD